MKYHTLELTRGAALATVSLNRPEVRNAFNEVSIAELADVFAMLGADVSIRAIVLAANGPAFCAGADLQWMQRMAGYSHAENLADATRLAEMLRTVYLCPKPVVAKVQGDCYGGGVGLVAACDIVVAAEQAAFCLSEVRLGLVPATISPYVIKAMGEQAARRYFLTAEKFSAQEAHRIGFVHETAAAEALDSKVDGIVQALMSNGPNAVRLAKQLLREMAGRPIGHDLVADTAERIAQARTSEEGLEGIKAFIDKRKPKWE